VGFGEEQFWSALALQGRGVGFGEEQFWSALAEQARPRSAPVLSTSCSASTATHWAKNAKVTPAANVNPQWYFKFISRISVD
jgi:hypothetical protein